MTELNIRQELENRNLAYDMLGSDSNKKEKPKQEKITESRIQAEIKLDKEYRSKRNDLIEAEELFHVAEKALFEAAKLRGFVGQAVLKKTRD